MVDKMWHFSENPRSCLTEIEVFCGFILNKRGSQTARQRDSSIKLKEEIDRIMTWFVKMIRDQGQRTDLETLSTTTETSSAPDRRREDVIELCWACVAVACMKKEDAPITYNATGEL
jgi:hypothetical protein